MTATQWGASLSSLPFCQQVQTWVIQAPDQVRSSDSLRDPLKQFIWRISFKRNRKAVGIQDSSSLFPEVCRFTVMVCLPLSVDLLLYFSLVTFQTPWVPILQGSFVFVIVTITPCRMCFVLDQLMGPQCGWERTSFGSFLSLTMKATGVY